MDPFTLNLDPRDSSLWQDRQVGPGFRTLVKAQARYLADTARMPIRLVLVSGEEVFVYHPDPREQRSHDNAETQREMEALTAADLLRLRPLRGRAA
jgi:hypothetical protein